MKKVLLTGLVLCLTASMAMASGLNFNWNTSKQCPTVQTGNWSWACDNNDATEYMVATVMPNIAVVGFSSMDARIDGQSVGPIPAWWEGFNAGACRATAFTAGLIDVSPTAPCAGSATTKLWTNTALGAIGFWGIDASNRFHIVVGFGMNPQRTANLSTTVQYNAFHIAVSAANTIYVAPDPDNAIDEVIPCLGCDQGVTFVLNQINLNGSGTGDAVTLPGTTPGATQCILYQGGAGSGVCAATPTRNSTWGQVKSLYR